MTETTYPEFNAEATVTGTPSATAFFTKGRETVWIHAFPEQRLVVVHYPPVPIAPGAEAVGVTREIPARDAVSAVRKFCDEVRRHRNDEWTQRAGEVMYRVYSADPWDVADPFTASCPF